MAKYPFLSEEWQQEARKIREEFADQAQPPAHQVKMNLIITDVPFQEEAINAHMDTSGGTLELDLEHLDEAELTLTLDYLTAKTIFVDANPQAGVQAFMAGKIKVQGDMSKLMAMQQAQPNIVQREVTVRIQEITE